MLSQLATGPKQPSLLPKETRINLQVYSAPQRFSITTADCYPSLIVKKACLLAFALASNQRPPQSLPMTTEVHLKNNFSFKTRSHEAQAHLGRMTLFLVFLSAPPECCASLVCPVDPGLPWEKAGLLGVIFQKAHSKGHPGCQDLRFVPQRKSKSSRGGSIILFFEQCVSATELVESGVLGSGARGDQS